MYTFYKCKYKQYAYTVQEKNQQYAYFLKFFMESEIITRLKEFIKEKGWSKAEFARRLDIFPQDVNRYLTGVNDIQKILIKLHKVGCDIIWLIDGTVRNNSSLASSNISTLPIQENSNIINTLTIENIILKARLEEKEQFIKLLLDRQSIDFEANIVKAG